MQPAPARVRAGVRGGGRPSPKSEHAAENEYATKNQRVILLKLKLLLKLILYLQKTDGSA